MRHRTSQEWRTMQALICNTGAGRMRNPLRRDPRSPPEPVGEGIGDALLQKVVGYWPHATEGVGETNMDPTWWDLTQDNILWRKVIVV